MPDHECSPWERTKSLAKAEIVEHLRYTRTKAVDLNIMKAYQFANLAAALVKHTYGIPLLETFKMAEQIVIELATEAGDLKPK